MEESKRGEGERKIVDYKKECIVGGGVFGYGTKGRWGSCMGGRRGRTRDRKR